MALKKTSSDITISGSVTESGVSTFTQAAIDLQLNPLDNEVFVVIAVDLDVGDPDGIAATNTKVVGSLSNTSRTTIGNLGNSNVFAAARSAIRSAGFADAGVGFQKISPETPTAANLSSIGILATDNFFAQVEGDSNLATKSMSFKVYGFRAKADSATYAALVQSELLSA
jgi:hypothetical protein